MTPTAISSRIKSLLGEVEHRGQYIDLALDEFETCSKLKKMTDKL
jgi:hypothetical protein